ncbi:hypothetical protein NKH34_24380 [Mesorhizobium sp. M1148]
MTCPAGTVKPRGAGAFQQSGPSVGVGLTKTAARFQPATVDRDCTEKLAA